MSDSLTIELHNLSVERLRHVLHYDQKTGIFRWNISNGRVKCGDVVKNVSQGYVRVQIDGRQYWCHRLAWVYVHGVWPTGQIDHINGDRSDNRFENLRDVEHGINQQNQRKAQAHNKSSSYLGVSWRKRSKKWRATITLKGKSIEIGLYETEEEAQAAYVNRKRLIHAGCVI